MTDDSTLTDFLEDRTTSDGSEDGGEDARDDRRGARDPQENVRGDSGLSTYAWGAYTCLRCGDAVERVWRDGDGFVCSSCKPW